MLGIGLSLSRPGQGTVPGQVLPGETLVLVLIGQSNMIGRAPFDGGSRHPPGILQWGRAGADDGQLVAAAHPLQHHDPQPGQMGLDITFTEAFAAAFPGTGLVLVPAAAGGSGFSNGRWNPGDDLYEDARARADAVMAQNPAFRFAGFLWHQGESDAGFAGYGTVLEGMITQMRAEVAAAGDTTPFVLGGLQPDWVAANPVRGAVQAAIEAVPAHLPATAAASSAGLAGDGNHFTAPGLRTLGARYFAAWRAAFSGLAAPVALGSVPDQSDLLGGLVAPAVIAAIPDQTDPLGFAVPVAIGAVPTQTDPLGTQSLEAPMALGPVPDQTDQIDQTGPGVPLALGQIPDQEDIFA